MFLNFEKKQIIIAGAVVAVVIAVSVSIYFFVQYQKSQALLKNPVEAAKIENQDIAKKIALLVDVPANEEPTIAAVSDADKLRSQPFFARAQNGDRVIFYPSTKRAILYRPSTNKIIEMSPVNVNQAAAPQPTNAAVAGASTQIESSLGPTATPLPHAFRVAIYNGTDIPKLANNAEKLLTDKLQIATVVKKDNATKTDYAKTLVIDLNGGYPQEAQLLAATVNGVLVSLPAGESKPDADVLVILGANYKTQ